LSENHELAEKLQTAGAEKWISPRDAVISFSGGVADCIEEDRQWLAFGDMGPELGRAIRRSKLCKGQYVLGSETIRATVIGAGSHSAQLSGSTVFFQNVDFPMKNLPVAALTLTEQALPVAAAGEMIRQRLEKLDGQGVLALPGLRAPGYRAVEELAEKILTGWNGQSVLVVLEEDMAKALGQQLALKLGRDAKILCIDRVWLAEGSYLDVGVPVETAFPVVIKTLILGGNP
jgi:ethanolamine utilization protein EutA